jgi:hypothetical protein
VKLTLVLFDNEYFVSINALPVAEILPLDDDTFVTTREYGITRRNRSHG